MEKRYGNAKGEEGRVVRDRGQDGFRVDSDSDSDSGRTAPGWKDMVDGYGVERWRVLSRCRPP